MKTISPGLQNILDKRHFFMADLITITLTDGAILRYNNSDKPIRVTMPSDSDPVEPETNVYAQTITINHTLVVEDLTNFPVPVQISDSENSVFANALANGYDIYFTDVNGNVLDHERSVWDVTNHLAVFYVRVPALSSSEDTVLYMYYGDSGQTADLQNAAGVWDENFRAVYHFEENPYTTINSPPVTGVLKDSTANGFDLSVAIKSGIATFPAERLVDGVVGHGWEFAGDAVVQDDTADLFNSTKPAAVTVEGVLTCTDTAVRTGWFVLCQIATGIASMEGALNCGEPYFDSTWGWWVWWEPNVANGIVSGMQGAAYEVSAWTDDYDLATARHIAHVAVDGGVYSAYVDGAFIGDGYTTANFNNTGSGENSLYLAKALRVNDDNLTGVLSEVRISDIARSAAWLQTTYNSLHQQSTFVTVTENAA